jgi:prefoldin subunit 5
LLNHVFEDLRETKAPNNYDDLSSHCTHLNSRVESLEQQVKELKKEKASLQECLDIAEGEEANTREAY